MSEHPLTTREVLDLPQYKQAFIPLATTGTKTSFFPLTSRSRSEQGKQHQKSSWKPPWRTLARSSLDYSSHSKRIKSIRSRSPLRTTGYLEEPMITTQELLRYSPVHHTTESFRLQMEPTKKDYSPPYQELPGPSVIPETPPQMLVDKSLDQRTTNDSSVSPSLLSMPWHQKEQQESTIATDHSPSILAKELTPPPGEDSTYCSEEELLPQTPSLQARLPFQPLTKSTSHSKESGSSEQCQRSVYWAATIWPLRQISTAIAIIDQNRLTKEWAISAEHNTESPHQHLLIKAVTNVTKTAITRILLSAGVEIKWLEPIITKPELSLAEQVRRYLLYLRGKGGLIASVGIQALMTSFNSSKQSKNTRTKTEEILDMVKAGKKCSEIVNRYPQLIEKVYKLARFRPPRTFRTNVLYIYGPSGLGKTHSIWTVLKYLRDNNYLS